MEERMKQIVVGFFLICVVVGVFKACTGGESGPDANGNYQSIKVSDVDSRVVTVGDTGEAATTALYNNFDESKSPMVDEWKEADGSYGHVFHYLIRGKHCGVKYEHNRVTGIHC